MSEYQIGDVAQLTGTNVSTLRLWEQHGLIAPARSATGRRIYTARDVERIAHILRLRQIDGLNMSAIKRALASSAAPGISSHSSSGQHQENMELGQRFRAARRNKGISLKVAAQTTSLPVSYISTFERTGRGATVASLKKLANCYDTSLTALSGLAPQPSGCGGEVVRSGEAAAAPSFGSGITILQLANELPSLDCQKWILLPGSRSDGPYSHHGEEFIHVLAGQFSIKVDLADPVILQAGDSISFISERPHAWQVHGDETVVLLWVNTPKSF